jgi:hypothetical protein
VNAPSRHALKRLAPAAALLLVATGLSTAAGLSAASGAVATTPTPALKIVTPSATQTVERDTGEPVYLFDLGMFAVAQKAAVEIRTTRPSYRKPPTATLSIGTGGAAKKTTLPKGLVPDVDHLSNFFQLTVTNSAGKQVKKGQLSFCPNSFEAARAVPDGPPTSPYPYQCGDHPFAIGGVFGIQRGWSVPALDDFDNPPTFTGPDGTYTLQVQVAKPWRQVLGMSAAQGTGTVKLTVKTVASQGRGTAPAPSAANTMAGMKGMAGMAGMSSAPTGSLSPQRAALEAARVRALGRPNVPSKAAAAKTAAAKSTLRAAGAAAVPAMTAAQLAALPKPDLRALPAYQIGLDTLDANGNPSKNTYLDFGATVWNAGTSPLVVDGFRRTGSSLMDAYQYFFNAKGKQVGSAPAGTLQWDPRTGHMHWHFTAFATYRLLNSTQKVALRSGKEAFCLAPTDAIDLNVKNANWRPESTDLSTACGQGEEGALSIREVLDSGWGDTYSQSLPGQSFDVTNVPNGIYYIEVLANPDHKLTELSTSNNRALREVKLGGTVGKKRTLTVYPYQGIKAP